MIHHTDIRIRFKVASLAELRGKIAAFKTLLERHPSITLSGVCKVVHGKKWKLAWPHDDIVLNVGREHIEISVKREVSFERNVDTPYVTREKIVAKEPDDLVDLEFEMW